MKKIMSTSFLFIFVVETFLLITIFHEFLTAAAHLFSYQFTIKGFLEVLSREKLKKFEFFRDLSRRMKSLVSVVI